ncbi:uncharacterized protein F4807DRAFT_278119 [Annulohypoxylon truncatum]|uniref:uncharacterized protein n=1 Tax=Annulohypoxylon truncatum TaxID=327061 RepID=UPI002008D5D4|nr:uncharacterized protein F4807DRAFT_278119 [Annulohypoxylon truncatum]KAI1205649.1 hypothetical protein F4807DRAFT_278119 [Annulohypoxylon truncatum]
MSSEGKAPKTFLLGATGYIGGDALKAILDQSPEQESNFSVLVRDPKKGEAIKAAYPNIRVVHGSLDDTELLVGESARADIVLHLAHADHVSAANAIIAGLKQRSAEGKTSYLVHCSGTGILLYEDMQAGRYGEASDKIYNDWEGLSEMTSFPDAALHRNVDKLVLAAGEDARIKTAVVAPPLIYGIGRGPGNQRSVQIPRLIENFIQGRKGFQIGEGKAWWNNVHVHDLSELFALFYKEALSGEKKEVWGTDGYYFAENGAAVWKDISSRIVEILYSKGLINDKNIDKISPEEAAKMFPYAAIVWGQNSRSSAIKARKLLGWAPKQRSLEDELPIAIDYEVKRLNLS